MRWLIAFVGAVLGSVVADGEGLLFGGALGFVIGWVVERERKRIADLQATGGARGLAPDASRTHHATSFEAHAMARIAALDARVEQLERELARLSGAARDVTGLSTSSEEGDARVLVFGQPDERGHRAYLEFTPRASAEPSPTPASTADAASSQAAEQEAANEPERRAPEAESARAPSAVPTPEAEPARASSAVPAPAAQPATAWAAALRDFLLGGNTVVRAGVLVLTVGIGLLLKYAADQAYLPIELRLSAAALLALGLVVLGYRLRNARPGFGTALQGGGVAALYLVTFFAQYAYGLLPAALTLGLLIAIATFSTVLAVAQDAVQLAVFGAIGGFLAPVLASTGGGNHVALFSYYALLNTAIAASAYYRAWRLLNWIGFAFTFGIGSVWGALRYEPAHMTSAAAFLALFFLFYVLVGTLFALRRTGAQRGAIDTTLTFGTPLATLALAGGLFQLTPLYLALWCAAMSALYLATAAVLLRRRTDDRALQPLAQAYVALGIGVATLAIPFALRSELGTALAWSAEASGLIWVGVRQQRLRTRSGGYLLFLAALVSLCAQPELADRPANALFLALVASSMLFAASYLERSADRLRTLEPQLGRALLVLGFLLWLGCWHVLFAGVAFVEHRHTYRLLAHAFDMIAFEWLGRRIGSTGLRLYPRLGFPMLVLATLEEGHVSGWSAQLAWPVAILASYFPLARQEPLLAQIPRRADLLHALSAWVIAGWLVGLGHQLCSAFALADGWQVALHLGPPLIPIALAIAARPSWPFATHTRGYRLWAAWPMLIVLALLACVAHAASDGDPAPLPYLPLLNPFDLQQLFYVAALIALAQTEAFPPRMRNAAFAIAACAVFMELNGCVVRTAHHWGGVPFREFAIPTAPLVQAAFSIVWTLLALVTMLLATKYARRTPWIAGASLLALVVGKLFLLDLAGLSGGAKIVTFLAVGVLLLLIGYFAPVPPAASSEDAR